MDGDSVRSSDLSFVHMFPRTHFLLFGGFRSLKEDEDLTG